MQDRVQTCSDHDSISQSIFASAVFSSRQQVAGRQPLFVTALYPFLFFIIKGNVQFKDTDAMQTQNTQRITFHQENKTAEGACLVCACLCHGWQQGDKGQTPSRNNSGLLLNISCAAPVSLSSPAVFHTEKSKSYGLLQNHSSPPRTQALHTIYVHMSMILSARMFLQVCGCVLVG